MYVKRTMEIPIVRSTDSEREKRKTWLKASLTSLFSSTSSLVSIASISSYQPQAIWESENHVFSTASRSTSVRARLCASRCMYYGSNEAVVQDSPHTIGVEFGTRIVEVENKKIKLQVRSANVPLHSITWAHRLIVNARHVLAVCVQKSNISFSVPCFSLVVSSHVQIWDTAGQERFRVTFAATFLATDRLECENESYFSSFFQSHQDRRSRDPTIAEQLAHCLFTTSRDAARTIACRAGSRMRKTSRAQTR
jgi:hypothetical protein